MSIPLSSGPHHLFSFPRQTAKNAVMSCVMSPLPRLALSLPWPLLCVPIIFTLMSPFPVSPILLDMTVRAAGPRDF